MMTTTTGLKTQLRWKSSRLYSFNIGISNVILVKICAHLDSSYALLMWTRCCCVRPFSHMILFFRLSFSPSRRILLSRNLLPSNGDFGSMKSAHIDEAKWKIVFDEISSLFVKRWTIGSIIYHLNETILLSPSSSSRLNKTTYLVWFSLFFFPNKYSNCLDHWNRYTKETYTANGIFAWKLCSYEKKCQW